MKHFDIVPPAQLKKYQAKAAAKKRLNNALRHQIAVQVFKDYGDISIVMGVFHVSREQAYKMVRVGKEAKA